MPTNSNGPPPPERLLFAIVGSHPHDGANGYATMECDDDGNFRVTLLDGSTCKAKACNLKRVPEPTSPPPPKAKRKPREC